MKLKFLIAFSLTISLIKSQDFNYEIMLKPVQIEGLAGLHSYAWAKYENKIVIIGGRKDGVHPRQPFNAFPNAQNNDSIFVIDIENQQFWKKELNTLPTNLAEQLQSTNMNFYQDSNKLLITGGYAYSNSRGDHVTFPYLTLIDVPNLITHIIKNEEIIKDFQQIENQDLAVTGGNLNKLGDTYFLIGGQRFTGRYNPRNNPTFVQTYTNGIQRFRITNFQKLDLEFDKKITDPMHLHRRDFNLMAQISENNEKYLLISSGVFQLSEDLPFLYPVAIHANEHHAHTEFNQYLSNYQSAKALFYDEQKHTNYSVFFGGISQHFFRNDSLINDPNVPFVKTISLLKNKDNNFEEFKFNAEMPKLKGAGAEFFPSKNMELIDNELIKLNNLKGDSILVGQIFGGIESSSISAFTDNETALTNADANLYEVILVRNSNPLKAIHEKEMFQFNIYPNPKAGLINIEFKLDEEAEIYFYITDLEGTIIDEGLLAKSKKGKNVNKLNIEKTQFNKELIITISENYKNFDSKRFTLKTIN
jgi:hypothetical protein